MKYPCIIQSVVILDGRTFWCDIKQCFEWIISLTFANVFFFVSSFRFFFFIIIFPSCIIFFLSILYETKIMSAILVSCLHFTATYARLIKLSKLLVDFTAISNFVLNTCALAWSDWKTGGENWIAIGMIFVSLGM